MKNEVKVIVENVEPARISSQNKMDILTTEIIILKNQTANNLIEIGKRLIAVKEGLPHGEWGRWLKEEVDFTERTAQRIMRAANEMSNTTALSDMSRSKVFALLEMPKEEREEFINTNQIDDMSTRQLQQAIKDKKALEVKLSTSEEARIKAESDRADAIKEAETEHQAWKTLSDSCEILKKTNQEHNEKAETLRKELEVAKKSGNNKEIERLEKSIKTSSVELASSQKKIKDLEQQIKDTPIEIKASTIIEKIPELVEKELLELRNKSKQSVGIIKYTVCFDSLVKDFENLLGALDEIKETDIQEHERYKKTVAVLIEEITKSLKE